MPELNLMGAHLIVDKEFVICFNNDNLLIVKETLVDMRRMPLSCPSALSNSKDDMGNEWVVDLLEKD